MTTGLGILLSILGGIALVLTLQRPISHITAAMRRIAEGALDTSISGEQRHDEIGDMARALGIFKENAISKIRIEEQSDEERAAAEHERQRNDAEKREMDRQIEFAVNALARPRTHVAGRYLDDDRNALHRPSRTAAPGFQRFDDAPAGDDEPDPRQC